MDSTTKIFVAYHKPSPVFESGIYVPIHVGAAKSSWDSGLLRDDTGDNISLENPRYCELTGLYWAWKNYLPAHPEVRCVGLCHYRRFLNPFRTGRRGFPFRHESFNRFSSIFASWDEQSLSRCFENADVVLPTTIDLRKSWLYDRRRETIYSQMCRKKLTPAMDAMITELIHRHPGHATKIREFYFGPAFHCCLTFAMKRETFLSFAEWMFSILETMAQFPDENVRRNALSSRALGFLAERLVDVWLIIHPELVVKECDSIQLFEKVPSVMAELRTKLRRFKHPPVSADSFPLPKLVDDL